MIKLCRLALGVALSVLSASPAFGQSIRIPWSGYAHAPQHGAAAPAPSQPLNRIRWSTPVDLNPDFNSHGSLLIHYGSPLITRSNTVIVPVKTGLLGGFCVKALVSATGATNWTQPTDYILPPFNWTPSFSPALTPKNRLYFAGGGGTVYYCDTPDTTNASPTFGQIAFYGLTNYLADTNDFLSSVFINTPITSDRYGNIFFGFEVIGFNPLGLESGLARIAYDGTVTWISAEDAAPGTFVDKVAMNCSPALSNDHKTVYFAVNGTDIGYGCLVALDSRTLAPLNYVRLEDVVNTNLDADVDDDSSASPVVGPDGDVYYGVLENPPESNNYRGWLLHFNSILTQLKIPGAFGWDDTPSIVPASLVASYTGSSTYLLMTKYNNYADIGSGDGVNRIAILDPQNSESDPINLNHETVMAEVITIADPTPDLDYLGWEYPDAVREWCINSAAVDPFTKSILANNEDGNLYRWDLTANTLSETNTLTSGIGEAYTPTLVGSDGVVYAINDATLFSIGR